MIVNIICLDGASGSSSGRGVLSKLTKHYLAMSGIKTKARVVTRFTKGTVWPILRKIRKKRLIKRMNKYAHDNNMLVLVGKSLGAIWCLDLLTHLMHGYGYVVVVTVDPHNPGYALEEYTSRSLVVNTGLNVHQRNMWPKGGHVKGFTNHLITRNVVDHFNITNTDEVRTFVSEAIRLVSNQLLRISLSSSR